MGNKLIRNNTPICIYVVFNCALKSYTGNYTEMGYAVAQLVEVLHYKPEGRGVDSRRCHWNSSLT